jgi:hypothetical protein
MQKVSGAASGDLDQTGSSKAISSHRSAFGVVVLLFGNGVFWGVWGLLTGDCAVANCIEKSIENHIPIYLPRLVIPAVL